MFRFSVGPGELQVLLVCQVIGETCLVSTPPPLNPRPQHLIHSIHSVGARAQSV